MHAYSHLIGMQEGTIYAVVVAHYTHAVCVATLAHWGAPGPCAVYAQYFPALELLLLSDKHTGQLVGVLGGYYVSYLTANDLRAVCVAKSWASG